MEAQAWQQNPEENGNQQSSNDETRLWRMRWYFFWVGTFFCGFWAIATIGATVVVFIVSKSYFSFLISSGIAISIEFIRRLSNYLLPMDEKRFQLKKLKIELRLQRKKRNKKIIDRNSADE